VQVSRVLDEHPVPNLQAYLDGGGGVGLQLAVRAQPTALIATVGDAGLRGRGGAGFPTAVKWDTVARSFSDAQPTAVVVNAAEGEPGTFKDRAILRANPYRVLEGALIAARAVGAREIVVGMKATFEIERARVVAAMHEFESEGLYDISMRVVDGPSEYLFGEESALLEVVEGRQPFPRITPPYRRGLDEGEIDPRNPSSTVALASEGGTDESPALVDNVETLANVPGIVEHGPAWFRNVGTEESPGTVVCTVTGATRRHGVGEFAMGTPLREVIEVIGRGAPGERALVAALAGTANAAVAATDFDTPLTYEHFARLGSGLGTAGFIVFDDETDLIAVAHGVARFLAVESCGQCVPCKDDGLAIALALDAIRSSLAGPDAIGDVRRRFATVADGARCSLAAQHTMSVASLLELGRTTAQEHIAGERQAAERYVVAPMIDLIDGQALLDATVFEKNPDWSYGGTDSASAPAELYADTPVAVRMSESQR
jgi:NADH-quinone oxidoreductase subunit F